MSPTPDLKNRQNTGLHPRLSARDLSVSYHGTPVLADLNVDIPTGVITTLIGPNGCGKSTLLKSLATVLDFTGSVTLDGRDITAMRRTERARLLAMLPQQPVAPDALTVEQLVARGRHPHQSWLQRWSSEDETKVAQALALTNTTELSKRPLSELSGGQRQRVWIAMTLAQDTPTLLLDEPTTYLDLAHSIELLRLVEQLRDTENKTIVMVLHDLNLAVRYSDHLIAMGRDGTVYAYGSPETIVTPTLLAEVFGLAARVIADPVTGGPLIVPEKT